MQKLLADEHIELSNFPRADAYIALYPFLSKVVVPRGVGDLAKDLPPTDVTLFATKASLVVHKDLHPAIQYLLLNAAVQIHSKPSIFRRPNQFPAAEAIDIPLSSEALQFYKSGRPYLHNYLPFWAADLFGKLHRSAHSDLGRALPDDEDAAAPVRLGDAIEDCTHLRRAEISGG